MKSTCVLIIKPDDVIFCIFSDFEIIINILEVRVRFEADREELNIYNLKDLLYTDGKSVKSFQELIPGTKLKAKWPSNSKFYESVVINPLAEIEGLFLCDFL